MSVLRRQPLALLSSSSSSPAVMESQGVRTARFLREFYEAKEKTIAAVEKCAKQVKRRARQVNTVRKMQARVEESLEGLSWETESLHYAMAAIGFSNYAKILQLKIRCQIDINDLILLHCLKLDAIVPVEKELYESLKLLKAILKDNEDVLNDLIAVEETLGVGGDQADE